MISCMLCHWVCWVFDGADSRETSEMGCLGWPTSLQPFFGSKYYHLFQLSFTGWVSLFSPAPFSVPSQLSTTDSNPPFLAPHAITESPNGRG